jgi:hypothetical protein
MPGDARARCSIEGCEGPPTVVTAAGLLCEEHAAVHLRCAIDGCGCWADVAIDGRPMCRHHAVELRQSGEAASQH